MCITAAISCFLSCAYRRAVGAGSKPAPDRVHAPAGAFQRHSIHCGPEARAPRCEREGWFPNLISPPSSSTGGEEWNTTADRYHWHRSRLQINPLPPTLAEGKWGVGALCKRERWERWKALNNSGTLGRRRHLHPMQCKKKGTNRA